MRQLIATKVDVNFKDSVSSTYDKILVFSVYTRWCACVSTVWQNGDDVCGLFGSCVCGGMSTPARGWDGPAERGTALDNLHDEILVFSAYNQWCL